MKLPQTVVIVTHELFYGAAQALRDFLIKHKIKRLSYISHPLLKEHCYSMNTLFQYGKSTHSHKIKRSVRVQIIQYVYDLWLTIYWLKRQKYRYEIYIGVDPLNVLGGLLLKRLKLVHNVIFYGIDFTPKRFSNPLLNNIYHTLEILCVKNCDETWNVSPRMSEGREKYFGVDPLKYPQKTVPIGVWKNEISTTPHKINKKVGFAGHLLGKQGVQKVIEALVYVKDMYPDIQLLVIGGGEYAWQLKKLSNKLLLHDHVIFTGWISDQKKIRRLLSSCSIATATYSPDKSDSTNFTYYADPTKIKTYLSCGLPVVMTRVSYNAKEIETAGCARLVDYDARSIADAIMYYFSSPTRILQGNKAALRLAQTFTWDKIFAKAFVSTL